MPDQDAETTIPAISSSSEDPKVIKKREKRARQKARKKEQKFAKQIVDVNKLNSFIKFESYKDESQLEFIVELTGRTLSEPYSLEVYEYFLGNWPNLSVLVSKRLF